VWLISLGSNGGTPFYLNLQKRVNTILKNRRAEDCPPWQMARFASVVDPSRLAVSKTEWVRAGQKASISDHQCCALV